MEEIWKDIPGYYGYQASTSGKIRSIDRTLIYSDGRKRVHYGKELSTRKNKDGYLVACVGQSATGKRHIDIGVHILIAKTFLPNRGNLEQVNHIDGDKTNNAVNNLEWVSRSQNIRHAKYILGKDIGTPCKRVVCVETGKEYSSIREAWRYTGIHWTCIAKALGKKEGRTTAGGFHWTEK